MDGLALASRAGDKTATRRVGEHQPCAVGDVIAVCEALVPSAPAFAVVAYRSDGTMVRRADLSSRQPWGWPWKVRVLPARYCPAWAVRTFLRVLDVRREPLDSIDDEDVRREGLRYLGLAETREDFLATFQKLHHGIAPDTLIWRVHFERDVGASFPDPRPGANGPDHRARELFEHDVRARLPILRGSA